MEERQILTVSLDNPVQDLAHAWGEPVATGCLRGTPEDFQVSEISLLEPQGEGEHVWLLVRKRLENTADVASLLARCAGVPLRDVSYAGLKDRQAVTEQWFSVHLPGSAAPDWSTLDSPGVSILRSVRHGRKLRRGALRGNRFRISVRDLVADPALLRQRLETIAAEGVPNYFGEQRFGRDGSNLRVAERLFRNPRMRLSRHQRGLVLSAARSQLFNAVLSRRVSEGSWNRLLPGDVLQLQGSHSYFVAAAIDAELQQRLADHDIHPTGPLYGRGKPPVQGEPLALETAVLAGYPDWLAGLEAAGLKQERRALRLTLDNLEWRQPAADVLCLEFSLPAGAYATSVLRELLSAG
jgi:tRNA pseudouridine13 synthase